MRFLSEIRETNANLNSLVNETIPDRIDVLTSCLVVITVVFTVTCLIVVAQNAHA